MSADPLRDEHESLQRAVAAARCNYSVSVEGAFARTMMDAMDEFHRMRSEGVSFEDGVRGIESVLRSCWPKPVSKFPPLCDECHGSGYRERTCCDRMRCQRERCNQAHAAFEHRYVEFCHCGAADRFRRTPSEPEDAVVAVGRVKKKPRGWSGVGRR